MQWELEFKEMRFGCEILWREEIGITRWHFRKVKDMSLFQWRGDGKLESLVVSGIKDPLNLGP